MEKKQSTNLIPPGDKPLPVCSRTVTCNQKDSPLPPKSGKYGNLQIKVQVENDLVKKQKFEDCSTDYRSPKIKAISPNAFSPDLGCFMDHSSPAGRDSSSTFTPSRPKLNEKTHASARDLREVLGSPVPMKHVDLRCKMESKCPRISSDFDNDVDDILCLNPLRQEEQQKLLPVLSFINNVDDDNEGCPAETASKQQLPQEALFCSRHLSFLEDDLKESSTRPFPGPVTSSCLEGVVKEPWNIGAPKFESSVCEGSPAVEHRNRVSQVQEDSVFVDELSTTGDSLWETTLPLQVQVKSKVVVPSKNSLQPSNTEDYSRAQNRPTVYGSKSELEHQCRPYVPPVISHMREDEETTGAMTELQDLMSSVPGQSRSHGARWQHPSDLTRRNYQQRFNEGRPLMSLSDWQRMNGLTYQRFANIPKIFKPSSSEHQD
ncbi:S100P-binding protein isoform X2 [Oryzias melastigma]|uniref:S100P-binding protein isoform X2 n=1 Tax=Oryzias melastigma TaxID=30732 RepID=UPI000CF7D793|nr:S100P-binding protein isoform X2 [Oryzias melastigma]